MVTTTAAPAMDLIMAPGKLKALLTSTRDGPVSVAVGVTSGDEPLMLLHKTAEPKKVMAQLKAEAAKAKIALNGAMTRFGVAHVDEASDPTMLKIQINKGAPDKLRQQLTQLVKRHALKGVIFEVDPSLEGETDDLPPVQAGLAQAGLAQAGLAQAGLAQAGLAQAEPALDAATIGAELKALVAKVSASGGLPPEFRAMATRSATALKFGDLATAAEALAALRAASEAGGSAAPGPVNAAESTRAEQYGKAQRLWELTLKSADDEVSKLISAIAAMYEPEGLGKAVAAGFAGRIRPAMDPFDRTLTPALRALAKADAGGQEEALRQARKIVADLRAHFAATPLLAMVDANPFTPVAIGRPIGGALAAIARTLA